MATVGLVGLGVMGRPMVRNLLNAGHTVVACGRTGAKVDAAVADGAQRGASNANVGARVLTFRIWTVGSLALLFTTE